MKKNLLLGLITIITLIIVSGCTNKNIDPKVVGKWKYTDDDFSVEYVFKENGTGTYNDPYIVGPIVTREN